MFLSEIRGGKNPMEILRWLLTGLIRRDRREKTLAGSGPMGKKDTP